MFLVGNINHPNVAYIQCVLGFEIERKFPIRVYSWNNESKANCMWEIQIISDCTDNW